MSVNKAILIGRLGKDPELRYPQGGDSVCNFSIATSEKWKDKSGEKKEKTVWHNIVIWGKLAEIANQYMKKGSRVYLEGAIENRSYEDKQGVKKYVSEVVIGMSGKMIMLDSGRAGEHEPAGRGEEAQEPQSSEDLSF